jgi:hypothetical protein
VGWTAPAGLTAPAQGRWAMAGPHCSRSELFPVWRRIQRDSGSGPMGVPRPVFGPKGAVPDSRSKQEPRLIVALHYRWQNACTSSSGFRCQLSARGRGPNMRCGKEKAGLRGRREGLKTGHVRLKELAPWVSPVGKIEVVEICVVRLLAVIPVHLVVHRNTVPAARRRGVVLVQI